MGTLTFSRQWRISRLLLATCGPIRLACFPQTNQHVVTNPFGYSFSWKVRMLYVARLADCRRLPPVYGVIKHCIAWLVRLVEIAEPTASRGSFFRSLIFSHQIAWRLLRQFVRSLANRRGSAPPGWLEIHRRRILPCQSLNLELAAKLSASLPSRPPAEGSSYFEFGWGADVQRKSHARRQPHHDGGGENDQQEAS